MVLQALKELNSTPEESIYVGDSEVDVATAENSGLLCIGVTWGFREEALLHELVLNTSPVKQKISLPSLKN